MRIDEKVREAHLEHFCPGGLGFPREPPARPGPARKTPPLEGWTVPRPARLSQRCGRCGLPVAPGQDVRRRIGGTWVHGSCPA